MNWFKTAKKSMALAMLCVLCIASTLNAKSNGCTNGSNPCNPDIDMDAYQRGRNDEAQGAPYHSYVRSKQHYSYNVGRKKMHDELQSESAARPVKISPQACKRYFAKRISAEELNYHGPMYGNPNGIQAFR